MKTALKSTLALTAVFSMALLGTPTAHAVSGSWFGDSAGNWSDSTKWTSGTIADGADFTATFGDVITADRIITLDSARTIGNITASDTSNNYTISGSILTLDVTTGAPIIDVTTAARTLTISSVIAGTDGLQKNGAGKLSLEGINTFTGDLVINGGTLGYNSFSISSAVYGNGNNITFAGSGTLQAPNTAAGAIFNKSLTVNPGVIANISLGSAAFSATFNHALTGTGTLNVLGSNGGVTFNSRLNTFTGAMSVSAGAALTVASLGSSANAITLGSGSGAGTFTYTGADALSRGFIMGGTTGAATINASGGGALTVSSFSISNNGAKTLTLGGDSLAVNTFQGNIVNSGAGNTSLTKTNGGVWALSGINSYSGDTNLAASGTTGRLIFQGEQALSANTTLKFAQSSSAVQSVSFLSDTAGTVSFNRPIQFGGTNTTQNLNIFVGNNNTANGGNSSGTTTGSTIQVGDITFTSTATDTNTTTINATGANGYRLQTGTITLNNLVTRTAGQTTVTALNPTSANMTVAAITMATGNLGIGADGVPVVRLTGTSDDNIVTGAISNASDFATGQVLSLQKQGTSTWTLNGTNTYTGTTAISAGKLLLGSTGSLAAGSAVTVSGGVIGGTGTVNGTVTVSSTGGIDLRNGLVDATPLTLGSTLGITGAAGANNLYFDLGNNTGTSDRISVVGTTTVTTAGAAVINLTQLGGLAGRNATTYTLITGAGTLDATNFAKFSLATTAAFGQTYALSNPAANGGDLAVVATNVTSATASAFWAGGDNNWSTASNWNTDATSNVGTGFAPDYQTNVTFSTTTPTPANLSNTLDVDFDINSLTFTDASGNVTVGGTKTLTIEAAAVNGNTLGNGIDSQKTSGTNTISAKVGLAASQTWTVAAGGTLSVSGAISDFGGGYGITKAGLGDLNLSGTNTFTGATIISAGILRLGSSTALSGTSGVSITDGASLIIQSSSPTFGPGQSLTLNGTGATGSGGALVTSTSGTTTWNGPVSLGSDSLVLTGGGTVLNIGGKIDLGAFTLTQQTNAATTFSGTVSGSGGLTKTGSSTLTLSTPFTYAGVTTINAGSLYLTGGSQSGGNILINDASSLVIGATGGQSAGTLISNNIVLGGTTAAKTLAVYNTNNSARFTGDISVSPGLSTTLNINTGNIPGGNSLGDRVNTTISGAITDFSDTNNGTLALNVTMATQSGAHIFVNLSGQNTFQGALTANTSTANSTGYLTIGGESLNTNATNTRNVAAMGNGYLGSGNYTGAITLNASGTNATTILDYNSSANQILGGQISGVGQLLKEGTGTLTLSATDTYTGATTITTGILQIGNGSTTGRLTATTAITNNANLTINRSDAFTQAADLGANVAITGTGSFTQAGAGTTSLTATNTYSGVTTISAGSLQIGDGGTTGKLTATSGITNNANLTINRSDAFTQATDLGAGVISGIGSFTQAGAGTTTLTRANTYTGVTTVSAGELDLNTTGNNAIAANITINGGTLKNLQNEQIANSATITQTSGAYNLNGKTETITGYYKTGGTFRTGVGGHLITTGPTVTYDGAGSNVIDAEAVVEDAHLVLTNGATVDVNSANSDPSATGAFGGTLQLNAGGAGLELNGSAGNTINLNSDTNSTTAAKLSLSGNVTTAGTGLNTIASIGAGATKGYVDLNGATRTFTVSDTAVGTDLLVSAVITNGGLTKQGLGNMTLSGDNTYSGATNVNAGILVINGDQSGATGAVMVNNGGTLRGTGMVGGATLIGTGGILQAGDTGPGLLTFTNDLTLDDGSNTNFRIVSASSFDQIYTSGVLTLNSTSNSLLNVFFDYNPLLGASFNLLDWGTLASPNLVSNLVLTYDNAYFTANNLFVDTSTFNTNGTLFINTNAAPEPSRAVLMLFGAAGLLLRRRRKVA